MKEKKVESDLGAMEVEFKTVSGIPLKKIYWPEDLAEFDPRRDLGALGEPPYARGVYPEMYRKQPWRIFLITGAGSIDQGRDRVAYALSQGESGFLPSTDISTWLMLDADHPEIVKRKEDVGWYGATVISLEDYRKYWGRLPIGETYCHIGSVLPHMGPYYTSCFLTLLEEKGIPPSKVNATGQGDFFLTYVGILSPFFIPPKAGLKLNGDVIEHSVKSTPRVTPVSIAGYNVRECGANAFQEMAIVLSCAIAHIEEVLSRDNLKIDDFAYTLGGINLSLGSDFFEEVAKFRAMRRMWYKLLKKYGAQDPRSLRLRIHGLPLGSLYTFQQPLNNIVRGTYTVLAGILGGAQSMGTPSFDEAICTPTELAHTTALRTQQILMHESNIPWVADPLGGSYFIESLTNELEAKAWEYMGKMESRGGFIACLDSGWLQNEVAQLAAESAAQIENGKRKVVGVNCYRSEEDPYECEPYKPDPRAWELAMESLERVRRQRDPVKAERAMEGLLKAIERGDNTMPATIEAVKSNVTHGEVGDIYRKVFGCWNVPSLQGLR